MMKYNSVLIARYGLVLAMAVLIVTGSGGIAQAQVGEATQTADPSRAGERFQQRKLVPNVSPQIKVKDQIVQKAPPGAEKIGLNLKTIQLDGVSAYTKDQLAPVYEAQLGTTVTLADVYDIAAALTSKYRNDGYILTQVIVPPQTIEGGKVKLRVVEGFIDTVTVQGEDEESAMNLIRSYASMISTGGALNVRDLERWLLLINDLPGVEARSILSPSTRTGGANLLIIVERDPFDALLAADNFGSRYLGPIQFSAAGSLNSFFGNNERITAQLVLAPDIGDDLELAYYALAYQQPVLDYGSTVEVFFSQTHTEPGYNLEQFDVRGHSSLFRVKGEHPFIRSRTRNLYVHVLFDWRDVKTKNNIELTRTDHLRVARAGGRYEFMDTLLNMNAAINSIGVEISKGLGILGNSDKGDANLTRARGDPTFLKATAEAQRLQSMAPKVNLLIAAKGQISSNHLLSSEEFGVGGINIGRAYDPSEIVGDEGIAGKVELQWNEPKKVGLLEDYQLYSFFDAGRIWNTDATSNDLKRESISSAGAGIRANFTEQTEAGLAVAFPLNRDVDTQNDRDPRVYFNVSRRF